MKKKSDAQRKQGDNFKAMEAIKIMLTTSKFLPFLMPNFLSFYFENLFIEGTEKLAFR